VEADAVENTAYFMPAEKWLLGVLNSKAAFWLFRQVSNTIRGGFVRFIRQYVEQIPIPTASPEKQKEVERLVDRILMVKARDAQADVSTLERKIDQLVYELYGLTTEEIQIVEGAA
jgi:adenine-specific DNA-methyltransferase